MGAHLASHEHALANVPRAQTGIIPAHDEVLAPLGPVLDPEAHRRLRDDAHLALSPCTISPTTRIIALAPSPTLRITRLNRPESPRIRSQSTSMRTRPDRVSLPPVDAPGYPVPDEGRMGFPWKSNKKARRKQVFPRRKSAPRSYGFCSSGRQIVNKPSSLGQVERNPETRRAI